MQKFFTQAFVLFLFFTPKTIIAQPSPPGCDGSRFIEEVFNSTIVSTVQYGQNMNNGSMEALIMDVYEPAGDMLADRPVIIFAHGGYFIFGNRTEMASLCQYFAKRGFVAATIDYRKLPLGTSLNSVNTVEAIVRTMQDMKAAVRYFREDRETVNTYKINPDFIAVGGYSAGAFTALHTAFWDEADEVPAYMTDIVTAEGGFIGESSNNIGYSSAVQAVISHSGALVDTVLINQSEPPMILYHGTADNVVPIGHGTSGGAIVTDGSRIIYDKAEISGMTHYFHPVQGGGHGDIFSGAFLNEYNQYLDSAAIVLEGIYCSLTYTATEAAIHELPISISPNPASGEITLQLPDDFLLAKNAEITLTDWLGRNCLRKPLTGISETIDVSHLQRGLYLLGIWNENSRMVKKVILD